MKGFQCAIVTGNSAKISEEFPFSIILIALYIGQKGIFKESSPPSPYQKIETIVKQESVFSRDLFNLYSDAISRELEDLQGFIIGWHDLNNLRYRDNTVDDEAHKKSTVTRRQSKVPFVFN